ncbi:hypothetical protein TWF481_001878 [Arthrobotrys musiformis]|uniref:MARVEL domain-containing protein n=1 Tax=Arthrobotrys musiformis TaxID=47236 RepID=A0AAV9VUS8_9PEZI
MHAERAGPLRGGLLGLRLLEFIFAVILVGILSWDHQRMKTAGYFSFYVSDVALGFSVAALVLSVMASFAHLFFHSDANIFMGVLDAILFAGFIASCIVYRQNFHVTCNSNLLVRVFRTIGAPHCGVVRLGAALLILQTILFFCTTILTFALASRGRRLTADNTNTPVVREEKRRFSFGRRDRADRDRDRLDRDRERDQLQAQPGIVQPETTAATTV